MIETVSDCNKFQIENLNGDWFVYVVPVQDIIHPIVNKPSILFIRNLLTKKTYYFAFDHPDSTPKVTHTLFVSDFLLTHRNKIWALDKKIFTQIINLPNVYDVNLVTYLRNNMLLNVSDYDTIAHNLVRQHSLNYDKVNLSIPLLKHKESFDELADDISLLIDNYEMSDGYIKYNDLVIDTLRDLESQSIFVDRDLFIEKFNIKPDSKGMVYSQYFCYTATGRPSNRFGGINYSALNKSDGSRSCFQSRYGKDGKMIVIDYTTFHPRIVCNLTNYNIPVEIDIYEYLAKLYFKKKIVDETDIKNSKQLTFRQFFGGVEPEYEHIKYLSNLKSYIYDQWNFFKTNEYVLTPFFKRKITAQHIADPNPPTVFNYLLQAAEGEIAIPKIKEVLQYLQLKKTKAVLYTYDAVLFDFHKDDGFNTLQDIRKIMSYDGQYPMKTYIGDTYNDVKLINL